MLQGHVFTYTTIISCSETKHFSLLSFFPTVNKRTDFNLDAFLHAFAITLKTKTVQQCAKNVFQTNTNVLHRSCILYNWTLVRSCCDFIWRCLLAGSQGWKWWKTGLKLVLGCIHVKTLVFLWYMVTIIIWMSIVKRVDKDRFIVDFGRQAAQICFQISSID